MVPARDIIFHRLWFTRYHFLMESDILWTIGGRINLKVCLNSLFIALQNEYHEYLVFCYPTFCNLMVTPDSRKIREQPRIARRILSLSGLPVVVYIPWLYPEKTEKLLHLQHYYSCLPCHDLLILCAAMTQHSDKRKLGEWMDTTIPWPGSNVRENVCLSW